MTIPRQAIAMLVALALASPVLAQTVKWKAVEGAEPPPLRYHGLLPGQDDLAAVKATLGEPARATRWYNYKMYYPAEGRPGMWDVVHMLGNLSTGGLGSIEAATIPEGYATEAEIRAKLGDPEYHLRMNTWQLLDYSERGLRFSVDAAGNTTGVNYVPHGHRRVPPGERDFVDLRWEKPPAGPGAPLDGLQAGAAEVVITPTGPDWLGPVKYTVHDDLKSRILVFSRGDQAVALVGSDVFGMGHPDVQVIRDGARALGIDHTIFGMSHNHAAGDTTGVYGFYPAEYIAHIQQRTIDGIRQAWENRRPVGKLLSAARELPMDGGRVMGLIRNARNPGVMDPTIATVQALDTDGAPIATLVHFACHVESLEAPGMIGADFPGYLCEQMKADGLGQPVFLNGALGGMISGDNPERTQESSREMGLKLAEIVKDLVREGIPPAEFTFHAEARRLELPLTNPAFRALMDSGPRTLHDGRVVTDMIYVQVGTAQFITLPGELLPEVSFEILEKMDGYPRMLVGLGNDQLGYMIPPYDFRDDYYEETMSVGPATAHQVRDMASRMLADHAAAR